MLANNFLNNSPSPHDSARRTSEKIFSKPRVNINIKHYKPFGCPLFILDTALQLNNSHQKWKERARVGI